ncbi:aminopeptidase [candidate division KSB1 bacterium]|nr:aminopeptidase [candidate division KSB1 bacterium]
MVKMKVVKKAALRKTGAKATKKAAAKAKDKSIISKASQARKKAAATGTGAAQKLVAQLEVAARTALETCLAVKAGETVLVITDEHKREIGTVIWHVAKSLGAEAMLAEIMPRSRNGEEPPAPIAALMAASSVVLCPTSKSLTHTAARREACSHGARIATLPGITEDMMIRCLAADYNAIAERSQRLSVALESGNEVHVTSPAGTDIRLIRGARHAKPDTGFYLNPGEYGNLPAGETFFAPIEGTAQGVIVFDGAMAGVGKVKTPIRIMVRNGVAVEITGGPEAQKLNELIAPLGEAARNIAELGIGTNDRAQITGVILEDEKVMGTVHIALGDNMSMGGTVSVPSHLDGLILQPTVYVDDRMIMEDGKLLVT